MNASILHIQKKYYQKKKKKDRILSDLNHSRTYKLTQQPAVKKGQILDEMNCNIFTKESNEHNLRLSLRPHERDSAVI